MGAVLGVSLGRPLFAFDRCLISNDPRALARLPLAKAVTSFDLARLSGAFSLIGNPLAQIGCLLARIGGLVSLISSSFARLRRRRICADAVLTGIQLGFSHLKLDLAILEIDVAILDLTQRRAVFATDDHLTVGLGPDQVRPPLLQHCAGALVCRGIAMQIRPRTVFLLRPERCSSLMRLCRPFVASRSLLMTV